MNNNIYSRLLGTNKNNRASTRGRNNQVIEFKNAQGKLVTKTIQHKFRTPLPS